MKWRAQNAQPNHPTAKHSPFLWFWLTVPLKPKTSQPYESTLCKTNIIADMGKPGEFSAQLGFQSAQWKALRPPLQSTSCEKLVSLLRVAKCYMSELLVFRKRKFENNARNVTEELTPMDQVPRHRPLVFLLPRPSHKTSKRQRTCCKRRGLNKCYSNGLWASTTWVL